MSADFERAGTGYDRDAYGHERQGRDQSPRTEARDEVFAAKILDQCSHDDTEVAHSTADGILIELLAQLGYTETVKAWQSVHKWYA